ncbi:MAG: right-handed parallel beta-helix repeat-containing protein, partial [Tepidisphaeraceae bacterium]
MNPKFPSAFARSAILPLLMVWLLAAPVARGRVIDVGPDRPVRTIDAALARAAVGDEIVLDRGIEHPTAGLRVTVDAIEIRSADGQGLPATITNTSTDKNATTFEHRADGLVLKDLILTGGGNVTCVRARGRRLTIDNVRPTNTVWLFVHLSGAQQTVIRNCETPVLPAYTVCAFDQDTRGLLIDRCTFLGSEKEHTIRLQRIYDAVLRDSTFKVGGWKSALTIREGADNRVENCTIAGPLA